MTRHRFLVVMLTLSLGAAGGCRRATPSAAAAAAPGPCDVALAAGPDQTARHREIARAQQDARGPEARPALERLGYLFIAQARVSNDPGDYTLAEAAAECLESRFPGEAASLLLRGHVLHQLHRFREAEQIGRALVARRQLALDYGLLGDALMEQGKLAEAGEAYQKMLDLKPFYQSYTRAAHLRWLKGDLDGAIDAIRLAIGAASPRDPESLAWAWTRLASYQLQAGRAADAVKAADMALGYEPEYAAALLAKGRALLAGGRSTDALDLLRRAAVRNPLPEYQWALADALRLHGLADEAAGVERELAVRGAAADPRTFALYLATRREDPARALALTERELTSRADVFTLDAHAWALAANGRTDDARQAIARALAEGTEDARLFLHAGAIHADAGLTRDARRLLSRAARLRATLLPSESDELARRLERLHRTNRP